MDRDDDNRKESRRIIGRLGQETEATMMTRVRDHMAGRDADETDRAEVWGTRIGRGLGLVLLVYLVWWIFDFVTKAG